MKTINELLHRLAELEPERCRAFVAASGSVKHFILYWLGDDTGSVVNFYHTDPDWRQVACLRSRVEQAVGSREFRANIRIGAVFAKYRAEIMFTINGHEGMVHADSDDSPAHALLAAYIKALEAVLFAAGPDVVPDGMSKDERERLYNAGDGVGFKDGEVES